MKLSRRQFITAGSLSALPVIGGAAYFSIEKDGFESESMNFISNVLKKHLPGIAIDHESMESFHQDWVNRLHKSSKTRIFIKMQNFAKRLSMLSPRLSSSMERLERDILTSFLLNSDFDFDSPSTETKYLGQNDSICSRANPFARFIQ